MRVVAALPLPVATHQRLPVPAPPRCGNLNTPDRSNVVPPPIVPHHSLLFRLLGLHLLGPVDFPIFIGHLPLFCCYLSLASLHFSQFTCLRFLFPLSFGISICFSVGLSRDFERVPSVVCPLTSFLSISPEFFFRLLYCLVVSFSLGRCLSVSLFLGFIFFFWSRFCSVFLFHVVPRFGFGLALSFGPTFSLGFALFWSRFFDRGWSVFEVPRRGNQPPSSTSQIPNSATRHPSSSYEFPSPTPHPVSCTLAINPDWFQQAKFAKQPCCSYISSKFSDCALNVLRQIPDRVAPFREFRDHTSQDRPQCLDHGSILLSPGRPRIFCSSSVDTCGAGVMFVIPTSPNFIMTFLLKRGSSAQAPCLEGRNDDGTSSKGFPISHYSLENIKHSRTMASAHFPLQKKSHSVMIGFCPDHEFLESGRCLPTRDGWNLKSQGDDLLPSCGVLELLDTSSPALDTLSNCLHSIATIRDQSRLLGINRD